LADQFQSPTSKNTINDLILSMLTTAVRTEAISVMNFLDLILEQIQNSKKTNARECFLVWLESNLHEIENNTSRLSLRDSIDWSYEPDAKELSHGKGKKVGAEYIFNKLEEIHKKEANPKIKAMIKTHAKKFEDTQIKGNRPLAADPTKVKPQSAQTAQNSESKKIIKKAPEKPTPKQELPEKEEPQQLKKPVNIKRLPTEEGEKKSLLNYSMVIVI
jgi:hypothetical protein